MPKLRAPSRATPRNHIYAEVSRRRGVFALIAEGFRQPRDPSFEFKPSRFSQHLSLHE